MDNPATGRQCPVQRRDYDSSSTPRPSSASAKPLNSASATSSVDGEEGARILAKVTSLIRTCGVRQAPLAAAAERDDDLPLWNCLSVRSMGAPHGRPEAGLQAAGNAGSGTMSSKASLRADHTS